MKHTKRTKFLANMMTASNNTLVNPVPTLQAMKDVLDKMKQVQEAFPPPDKWTLIAPDGRVWTGNDPLTLAAHAQPFSTELRNSK